MRDCWTDLIEWVQTKSPPRQREAFQASGLALPQPAVKLERTLVKGPQTGQARRKRGKWRTKAEDRALRELRWFFDQPFFRDQQDPEWGPLKVRPSGYGVAVQAPKVPTVFIPPSSFEHRLRSDTSFRCQQKAEFRARGHVVDTIEQVLEASRKEKEEARAVEAIKERAREKGVSSFEHHDPVTAVAPGEKGLTRKHRAHLRDCFSVFSAYKTRTGLFTGTLTSMQAEALAWVPNGWNTACSEFRRELNRVLKRKGLPLLTVDVTEIQMERLKKTGCPAPHMHMVLVVRNGVRKADKWLISKAEIHEIWNRTVNRVAMLDRSEMARTQLAGIEHDVEAYVSKYLSKGADPLQCNWSEWVGLQPKRWWNRSKEMKKAVEARSPELPGNMCRWLWTNRQVLLDEGLLRSIKRRAPMDLPVGEILEVDFGCVSAETECCRLYLIDVRRHAERWARDSDVVDGHGDKRLPMCLTIPSSDFEANRLPTIGTSHPGCFTESVRESLELTLRNSQIPEPLFLGAGVLSEEDGVQLKLL